MHRLARPIAGLLVGLVATVLLQPGCSRPSATGEGAPAAAALQIKGSDTMVNLGQAWAEAFGKATGVQVAVTGGGSGTGIAALLNGTCDIAESSRKMEPREWAQAKAKGLAPRETIVALDGLAVVVNRANPVNRLTLDQLSAVFTGRVTNWRAVGGADLEIVLLSREVNSGTHVYFKEHVLRKGRKDGKEEFAPGALLQPSSQAIADEVSQNPRAIGYYGLGYLSPDQKPLAVARTAAGPYVLPTIATISDGSYSISRPLIFYTSGAPAGVVSRYLGFVLSPEGQKLVAEQEFVPVATSKAGR